MNFKVSTQDVSSIDQEARRVKGRTLSEALPFMRKYADSTVVIKYGGNAMGEEQAQFASDIVQLWTEGIHPVVVHGGGPQISAMLKRLNIASHFVDGLRVTDKETMDVVEMVLSGSVNKQIVTAINQAGGFAVGLSGKDGNLMQATKVQRTSRDEATNKDLVVDFGFVGEPSIIKSLIIETLTKDNIIPVIAPIGVSASGETYNVNADTAAGAMAVELRAVRLLMLTDVEGVQDKDGRLITEMTATQAKALIADGTIKGGMIPKVETCLHAVENGVSAAVILDGRVRNVIILELFTPDGIGTLITAG